MRKGHTETFIDAGQVESLAEDLWDGEILYSKKKNGYYYVSIAKAPTEIPAFIEFAEDHGMSPKDPRALKRFLSTKKIIKEGY